MQSDPTDFHTIPRGGPVAIGPLAEAVLALIWERMRIYREAVGLPMPPASAEALSREDR